VPSELRGKRDAAELFHEILEHRRHLSEAAGRDVTLESAADAYVEEVLAGTPDERTVLLAASEEHRVLPAERRQPR
jgi:hypothetical protein